MILPIFLCSGSTKPTPLPFYKVIWASYLLGFEKCHEAPNRVDEMTATMFMLWLPLLYSIHLGNFPFSFRPYDWGILLETKDRLSVKLAKRLYQILIISSIFYPFETLQGVFRERFYFDSKDLTSAIQAFHILGNCILTVFIFFAITVSTLRLCDVAGLEVFIFFGKNPLYIPVRLRKFEGWDIKPIAKHWITSLQLKGLFYDHLSFGFPSAMEGISWFWSHKPLQHSNSQKYRFRWL